MGIYEDLFDLNRDGKVGFDDDLTLARLMQLLLDEDERQHRSQPRFSLTTAPHQDISESEERKRRAAVAAESKARKAMNDLYLQMLAVKVPCTRERRQEIKTAQTQYKLLLDKLDQIRPDESTGAIYVEWLEMRQDFLRFIRTSEEIDQILSGNYSDTDDPVFERAAEIARLEEELEDWELNEPDDSCSDAWDAWDERREELECKLEQLKDELDWEDLMASIGLDQESRESEDYQKAFEQASNILVDTAPEVDLLEAVVKKAQQLIEEAQKAAQNRLDSVEHAKWDLDIEEPSQDSPLWARWKKMVDDLDAVENRLSDITYL